MEENKEKQEKLSYEELEKRFYQVAENNRKLYQQLQSNYIENLFRRLDYLFKVVENSMSFTTEFVDKCVKEIVTMMTVDNKEEEEPVEE